MDVVLTRCVDVRISFQDADIVAFARAFERGNKPSQASTNDKDVDASVGIRPYRLGLHGGVARGKCVRHDCRLVRAVELMDVRCEN